MGPREVRVGTGQVAAAPPAERSHLAEIVPPRDLEGGIAAARGMLRALCGERVSLEIAVDAGGPRWYVRAASRPVLERALAQLRAVYPQARAEEIPPWRPDLDPAPVPGDERTASVELGHLAEPELPLRSDWRYDPDPLSGIVAGIEPGPAERVVARLSLAPARRVAAARIRRRAAPAVREWREPAVPRAASPVPLVALLAVLAAGLQGWRWYEAGEWMLLLAGGAAFFVALPAAAALAVRLARRPKSLPQRQLEEKLAAPLAAASLEVLAVGNRGANREHLRWLALEAAASYRAYDGAAGGGLRPGAARRPRLGRRARPNLLLNSDELAALWHLPDGAGEPASVRRTTARRLAPAPGHAERGARVGRTDAGPASLPVHMPRELLHRNQLIVAKTRRGKSTLLRHIAASVMEGVTPGETALVVVDPHRDLAEAVLDAVPPGLADRTTYLDFASRERPVGLNLLDRDLFSDRDRTTEHVITMMNRLWPQNWGPRMEGALRASLLALLDANARRERERQYTLLDVAPFLTDRELREGILEHVRDPAVRAWWRDNYDRVGRVLQQQTATPVTSKIGRFTVTEASRLVFGQARSTYDPREIVRDGGVLVVNTAAGVLGEGASSLVGATLLNLLGLLVEEQVALDPERRRRVVSLVDESSTLAAVDYNRMLSELGKYGASYVLVTQSLAKFDAVDRSLAPTLFANIDGLTCFGVSAEDARRLVPELGSGIEVEDLVSLDDFTCYARWWDGHARPGAFSFRVDPPPESAPGRAEEIARASAERVGRPRGLVEREIAEALEARWPAGSAGRLRTPGEKPPAPPPGGGPLIALDPAAAEASPARRGRGNAQRTSAP
ncbi:MAG: hypothetical protein OXC94_04635 [Chloroflexi bacterium]|nr:hypothetical protein [Chloroflexota bacterium]